MDMNREWTEFSMDAEVEHFGTSRMAKAHNALRAKAAELTTRVDILESALKTIAEYGVGADRNDGICPYGCDCPHIAQQAIR